MDADIKEYAGFVQNEWIRGVTSLWMTHPGDGAVILSGDAGCGKSHAVGQLIEVFSRMGLAECVNITATTHKAVGVLKQPLCTTYQSSLMASIEMCQANFDEYKRMFDARHKPAIEMWDRIVANRTGLAAAKKGHSCGTLNMRCPVCVAAIHGSLRCTERIFPYFIARTMFIIDEYGILSELALKKILYALSKFKLPGQGYILVFTGSVSQLPSPEHPQIWQTPLLRDMIINTYSLFINFRVEDAAYAEAINLFQFNVITRPAVELLNARVVGATAVDAEYCDSVTRIFNGNRERDAYNTRHTMMMEGRGARRVDLTPVIEHVGGSASCQFGALMEYMCSTVPKIFNKATKGKRTVYEGGHVFVLPTQERYTFLGLDDVNTAVVGREDDRLYLERQVTKYKGWLVYFFPIFPVAAINTYSAQGETLDRVIYAPPEKNYGMSSIRASAYVACTRVRTRTAIELSCNSFAKAVGRTNMFPENLLNHKKSAEMGYVRKECPY
ncbi:ORF25 [Ictalurid herpesvirus 1]|nr:ORF25 [Ictalurid herpesvirus 1]